MANACQCDNCKKIIGDDDIKIKLLGFEVSQNRKKRKLPAGYGIQHPEDFCSFECMAEWALNQQILLNDYKKLAEKYEKS